LRCFYSGFRFKRFARQIKLFIAVGFLLTVSTCQAQILEIGYGPLSSRGLGDLPKTSKINVSLLFKAYEGRGFSYVPGIRYTHLHSKNTTIRDKSDTPVDGKFNMLFLVPLSFDIPVGKLEVLTRFGFGFSGKHFPNKNGFSKNFLLETGLKYPVTSLFSLSLRYSHISNAGMGTINPGVDNVEIGAGFSF
jgi:hypothetical protein